GDGIRDELVTGVQTCALPILAIGASDAVGVGAKDPLTGGWVPRLGARLGAEARVVNLGVSGSTLAQALEEQLGPALDAQPDIVKIGRASCRARGEERAWSGAA